MERMLEPSANAPITAICLSFGRTFAMPITVLQKLVFVNSFCVTIFIAYGGHPSAVNAMAATPTPTPAMSSNPIPASTSQSSSSSAINEATRFHNRIFFAYVAVLILGLVGTILVWTSGNRVPSVIQADADARISEAHLKIAELTNENLKLQHVLLPRRIRVLTKGDDNEIRIVRQQELAKYANTFAVIQCVPDFEAETLAADIRAVLIYFGWKTDVLEASDSCRPWRSIGEGVAVVTAESRPFDLNNKPRNVAISTAGQAAKALVELLRIDLAMPFGESVGAQWKPEYGGRRLLPLRHGKLPPQPDVLILVGIKPISGLQRPPMTSNK